jgi:L-fuculose-phosphate aldolase
VDEGRLREALVAAGARLGARGLIAAGEGNASIRLDEGRLLITPSGRRKDELSPAHLVVVSARGVGTEAAGTGPRPSSDVAIHHAIYAARPDVGAIVHAHIPAAMALTVAGEAPDPAALPETALFLPRLPVVPLAAPGSDELAAAIAAVLSAGAPKPGAVLLERHGAVAVGDGEDREAAVAQAVDRIELIDVLCRVWRDALLIRAARRDDTGRAGSDRRHEEGR